MARPVKPSRTDTHQSSVGTATPIGCMDIETARGVVHVHDGPGYMTSTLSRDGLPDAVAFTVYTMEGGSVPYGLLAQMTPDEARNTAASLLRLANSIDPRKAH